MEFQGIVMEEQEDNNTSLVNNLARNDALKDEFLKKHESDLSVGTYAKKKSIELGLTTLGAVAGWFATGALLKRPGAVEKAVRLLGKDKEQASKIAKDIVASPDVHFHIKLIGGAVGSLFGGLPSIYGHWVNEEKSRIGVQEINEDAANLKIRIRTDPELVRENERLRTMLEKEEQKTDALKAEQDAGAPHLEASAKIHAAEHRREALIPDRETEISVTG